MSSVMEQALALVRSADAAAAVAGLEALLSREQAARQTGSGGGGAGPADPDQSAESEEEDEEEDSALRRKKEASDDRPPRKTVKQRLVFNSRNLGKSVLMISGQSVAASAAKSSRKLDSILKRAQAKRKRK
jgi:hypothetical protein